MDKVTGNVCPNCSSLALNIYYEDYVDVQLGAICDVCGLKGFFVNDKLVPLAAV